ncbi:MAG TPA: efflux RND transporter periplasmic adaptor subunit [Candidatus Hydrogenedentes bacterium]|nr:efflux RND transporter periplasmic adaptor subunit [Candidatus Hydrogenedentota bacterium]
MQYKLSIPILLAGVLVGTTILWWNQDHRHANAISAAALTEHPEASIKEASPDGHNEARSVEKDEHGHSPGEHAKEQAVEKDEHGHSSEGVHEEDIAVISEEQIKANNIRIEAVDTGAIAVQLALPGEVRLNSDAVAHVVPRVPGVVVEVKTKIGDDVKAGQVMAVLESRQLAALKAEYLAAKERESLARAIFDREKGLWDKKMSAEQDFLSAKQAMAEAVINVRSAEQQLRSVGFSDEYLKRIPGQAHVSYTRYEITAPIDGSVIEKHITMGESLKDDVSCFTMADLNTVWVNLSVYQKDIPGIQKGQQVLISASGSPSDGVAATVDYVGPFVGEQTRAATVRVVLPNENGQWRPGQFVTGYVSTEATQAVPVVVPKAALQSFENATVVFMQTDKGFVPVPIAVGRSDDKHVEVVNGLEKGARIVVEGAFLVKAEIAKAVMAGKTCSGH